MTLRPILAAAAACALAASAASGVDAPAAPGPGRAALVELFTSEGCSSCPPADALLARLAGESRAGGPPVIALEFHVDYWDRGGWKDPFSSAAYTARQRAYAARFGLASLYTPEMVVNGEREFVGSDASRAAAAIATPAAATAPVTLALSATADGRDVRATCRVAGAPAGAVLDVAWVDARAESAPAGGENGGRRLRHASVVRDLRSIPVRGDWQGAIALRRPQVGEGSVVAWVQAANAGPVLRAAEAPVAAANPSPRGRGAR